MNTTNPTYPKNMQDIEDIFFKQIKGLETKIDERFGKSTFALKSCLESSKRQMQRITDNNKKIVSTTILVTPRQGVGMSMYSFRMAKYYQSLRFHHPETQKDSDSIRPHHNPSGLFKNPQRDAEKTQGFFRHLGVDYSGY